VRPFTQCRGGASIPSARESPYDTCPGPYRKTNRSAPVPKSRMNELFDEVAEKFARETDHAMRIDGYRRGVLFLEMARNVVPPGGEVLDYGCGPGRLSLMLANDGFKVRGVDISAGMIAQARALQHEGLQLEFETVTDNAASLPEKSCDAIICSSVIEYVVDREALLHSFRRALRDPGVLIISYANRSSLWRRYCNWNIRTNPMYAPHHKAWSWREFRALLARGGFQTVAGPTYFESPLDWKRWGHWFRHSPLAGSLGALTARPVPAKSTL
jgi:2-polyprenyl-3-methyl-5-hydroxy-6-metoxy-1,4-benzoquinol methylase